MHTIEKTHKNTEEHVCDGEREGGEKRKGDKGQNKGGREEEQDKVR